MGPPPNNCIHRIRSSLITTGGELRFFRSGMVFLFGTGDAGSRVERARSLLRAAGVREVEDLRHRLPIPRGRWLCRTAGDIEVARCGSPEMEPLLAALVLGLCGPSYYADDRPIIWSEARLSRQLALHAPEDFYAEEQ